MVVPTSTYIDCKYSFKKAFWDVHARILTHSQFAFRLLEVPEAASEEDRGRVGVLSFEKSNKHLGFAWIGISRLLTSVDSCWSKWLWLLDNTPASSRHHRQVPLASYFSVAFLSPCFLFFPNCIKNCYFCYPTILNHWFFPWSFPRYAHTEAPPGDLCQTDALGANERTWLAAKRPEGAKLLSEVCRRVREAWGCWVGWGGLGVWGVGIWWKEVGNERK